MQPDRTAELTRLLRERILVLDGAMGTMIQQLRLSEADFRGAAGCGLHDHSHDLKGDNDLLVLTRPHVDARHPRRLFRGRRRHHRDEHVQRDARSRRPTTVSSSACARSTAPRRRIARASRGRVDGAHAGAAALRRRRAWADESHGVDLARRQRSRRAQRHVRRAGRRVSRGRGGVDRRRRRPAARRDGVRHAEREGGAVRDRAGVRRARAGACR